MAKKYLDYDGLLYFWTKLKTIFATKAEGVKTITRSGTTFTVTRADDTTFTFTQQDNTVAKTTTTPKMNGTAAVGSETKYAAGDHVHPSDTTKVDKVEGKGLSTEDYTTAEKTKLGGIAEGAEVNQNAFSNIKVGNSIIAADGKTDTLELVSGNGVNISADTANDKVTFDVGFPSYSVDGAQFNIFWEMLHYGECSTAAGTAAKVVTVGDGQDYDVTSSSSGDKPVTGAIVYVKFKVTNSAAVANLTLNVNSTGAHGIKYRNANLSSAGLLAANRIYCFVFDGTYWQIVGDLDTNTTYTNESLGQGYGTCTTAADTAAKAVTLSGYALVKGGVVSVKFTNAVPANATMNINSKGAKPIYNKGAAITAGIIPGGRTATFIYDGTNYHLISIDGIREDLSQFADALENLVTTGNGLTYTSGKIAMSLASDSAAGAMSSTDKIKLNKLVFDANNLIDSSILPSYVDDVIEAYPRSGQTELSSTWLATGSASGSVITPEAGKIYVLMADSTTYATNTQFRWSGTAYVKLNDGGVSEITNGEIDTILAS